MADSRPFILGEFRRRLDERYRLSIPSQLAELLTAESSRCLLAKERPGCLSLWSASVWDAKWNAGVELIRQKIQAGRLEGRFAEVQRLGRLLSTRHRAVELAGRGRLLIPEGFREFLGVEPGGELMVVGAAVCLELWHPQNWNEYLAARMPRFGRLFDRLSR
ncbi:MAG: division/cell wall cluster transcriptional repressor MraZ [Thermoguttaceae bacterium]